MTSMLLRSGGLYITSTGEQSLERSLSSKRLSYADTPNIDTYQNSYHFHAIVEGRYKGIVKGVNKLKQLIDGYEGAVYRSFCSFQDAQKYLNSYLTDETDEKRNSRHSSTASSKRMSVKNTSTASSKTSTDGVPGSHLDPVWPRSSTSLTHIDDPKIDTSQHPCNFHAVVEGRYKGIVKGVNKLKQFIDGYEGADYRSFCSFKDAQKYLESYRVDKENDSHNSRHSSTTSRKRKSVEDTSTASSKTTTDGVSDSSLGPIIIDDDDDNDLIVIDDSDDGIIVIDDDDIIDLDDDDDDDDVVVLDDIDDDLNIRWDRKLPQQKAHKMGEIRKRKRHEKIFLREYSMLTAPPPRDSNDRPYFHAILFFDGGFRYAHNIAGAGAYLRIAKKTDCNQTVIPDISLHKVRWYSDKCINSMMAEYNGLLQGLMALIPLLQEFLESINIDSKASALNVIKEIPSIRIHVYGDCLDVIKPMKRTSEVRNHHLQLLHFSCVDMVHAIQQFHRSVKVRFRHIYRKHNTFADQLAKEAMDKRRSWTTVENCTASKARAKA